MEHTQDQVSWMEHLSLAWIKSAQLVKRNDSNSHNKSSVQATYCISLRENTVPYQYVTDGVARAALCFTKSFSLAVKTRLLNKSKKETSNFFLLSKYNHNNFLV